VDCDYLSIFLNLSISVTVRYCLRGETLLTFISGCFFKTRYISEKPFSKNGPTGKNYIFSELKNFEKEKNKAIQLVRQFYENGPEKCT
jgi:hypothetical protein